MLFHFRLVSLHVQDKQTEQGNGYFMANLKRALRNKEEEKYDAFIKQVSILAI